MAYREMWVLAAALVTLLVTVAVAVTFDLGRMS